MHLFQKVTAEWLRACFPPEAAKDAVERCDRFLEEAIELTQACGHTAARAHALVDYVYSRPAGETGQELGGTMVTLAALANTVGLEIEREAFREIDRVREPETMAKIRAKQAAKPTGSALPIAVQSTVSSQLTSLRPEVRAFALLMERELRANEHKGGWQNETVGALMASLFKQMQHLSDATHDLLQHGVGRVETNRAAVIENAADVGNFAMMVADVVGGLRRPPAGEVTAKAVRPLYSSWTCLMTEDGDPYAAFIHGHVEAEEIDIAEAVRSVVEGFKRFGFSQADILEQVMPFMDVDHFHLRPSPSVAADPRNQFYAICEAGVEGAFPVTGARF